MQDRPLTFGRHSTSNKALIYHSQPALCDPLSYYFISNGIERHYQAPAVLRPRLPGVCLLNKRLQ